MLDGDQCLHPPPPPAESPLPVGEALSCQARGHVGATHLSDHFALLENKCLWFILLVAPTDTLIEFGNVGDKLLAAQAADGPTWRHGGNLILLLSALPQQTDHSQSDGIRLVRLLSGHVSAFEIRRAAATSC